MKKMDSADQGEPSLDVTAALRSLLDEREIREVLLRYCRGVDRCDAGLIASCYHDDAVDDHGNWFLDGPDVAPYVISRVKPGSSVDMHFVGNMLIEVQGDLAFAESYLLAFRVSDKDGAAYHQSRALRYIDRFERRQGIWRISERVVADDWDRLDPIVAQQPDREHFRRGCKDQNDPVYAIRKGPLARKNSTWHR